MSKYRVGVLVNEFNQEVGGAHNFVQAVASALPFNIELDNIELVLLTEKGDVKDSKGPSHQIPRWSWLETRIIEALDLGISPKLLLVLNSLNPMSRKLRKLEIDFLFFLGSSAIPLTIPYGVVVWDVQHRTHPWFPELKPGWEARDRLAKNMLPRASVVITGTQVGRNQLMQIYGVQFENIYLIPHPVPSDIPKIGVRKKNGKFTFIYPAQFWPHKNHVVILEAMRQLSSTNSLDFNVTFVGSDKGNLSYILEKISEYSLSKHIEIKGFVSRSKLLELYRDSDALLYSSFSGPENLPPLEAFQSSRPVLYADFPGAREQLLDAALYFDPTDEMDLATKIVQFVGDAKMRAKLIRNGHKRLLGKSNEDFATDLVTVLQKFARVRRAWE